MNAALLDSDRQHYGRTLAVLVIAALAFALQQTMVAPALPAIQEDLGRSSTTVTFVLTGFLLTASVSTPITGRLGDMFGKERMLVICLSSSPSGSLVCALSHSIEVLIAGRAIQGSAAAVFPLSFGIIRDEFPRREGRHGHRPDQRDVRHRGRRGPRPLGPDRRQRRLRWIFWLALPAILIAIIMTFLFIPESPVKSPAKIDWGGAALLSTTLICLLVGVSEANSWGWGDPRIVGLFAAALIAFIAWVRYEGRQPQPLVDIDMMRERAVLTTNVTALLVGFGMFGSFILIPLLVQLPAESGVGFGATVHQGRPLHGTVGGDHALRRPAGGLARQPRRVAHSPDDRHRPDRRELRDPGRLPRDARMDLRLQRDPRPWDRLLLRVYGEPRRRGCPSDEDRRGHRASTRSCERSAGRSVARSQRRSWPLTSWLRRASRPPTGFELAFGLSAGVMVLALLRRARDSEDVCPTRPSAPVRVVCDRPRPPALPARPPRAAASDPRPSRGRRARSRLSAGAHAPSARNPQR